MKRIAITTIVAGGLFAGVLGTAAVAQADYGRPDVSGVATYQGPARQFDYDLRYGRDYDDWYDDDRYYDGRRHYDAPYYGRPDGPTFSIGPNGVAIGF